MPLFDGSAQEQEVLLHPPVRLARPAYWLSFALAAFALVQFIALKRGVKRARALAARGQRFERRLATRATSILILGDSTGVGVGARRPEESIAGLLAADFPDADIVNISQSGARVVDTVAQARRCSDPGRPFDVAVLHVGANDVARATPTAKLAKACDQLMLELPRLARRTVWLGPPNLGLAPLFTPPYSWILAARSRAAATIFAQSAARHGVAFIDFAAKEHGAHFRRQRQQHFAVDGFHPNSHSYGYGYAVAREAIGLLADRDAANGAAGQAKWQP
jgi:lysophospholipase L1-like esterase